MKHLLQVLMLWMVSLVAPAQSQTAPPPNPMVGEYKGTHTATHRIFMSNRLDDAGCSGTAIAQYALLSATHCELGTDEVVVDGDFAHPAKILKVLRDTNDHSIFLTDMKFDNWVDVDTTMALAIPIGEDVFQFGNPSPFEDIFRKGYLSGWDRSDGTDCMWLVIDDSFGDSGSAVFDAKSRKLIGVVSIIKSNPRSNFVMTGLFPIKLTDAQWEEARKFEPKK